MNDSPPSDSLPSDTSSMADDLRQQSILQPRDQNVSQDTPSTSSPTSTPRRKISVNPRDQNVGEGTPSTSRPKTSTPRRKTSDTEDAQDKRKRA